jgi:hypothetical protein
MRLLLVLIFLCFSSGAWSAEFETLSIHGDYDLTRDSKGCVVRHAVEDHRGNYLHFLVKENGSLLLYHFSNDRKKALRRFYLAIGQKDYLLVTYGKSAGNGWHAAAAYSERLNKFDVIQSQQIVEAMKRGSVASLKFSDEYGKIYERKVSLSGITAALSAMREKCSG